MVDEKTYTHESQLPVLPPHKCGKRNKICRRCLYRFVAGDKALICPECGADRRCRSDKVKGYKTCRMHGGTGGRPPTRVYTVVKHLKRAYNIALEQAAQVRTLAEELAALRARNDQLFQRLDRIEEKAAVAMVRKGLDMAQAGSMSGNTNKIARGVSLAIQGVAQLEVENETWYELRLNSTLIIKIEDTMQKWDMDNQQMISAQNVFEIIVRFYGRLLKYVRDSTDRRNLSLEIRQLLPPDHDLYISS